MKALKRRLIPSNKTNRELGLIAAIMGIIAPATAFAASATGEEGSGIFIWIFLGFFAVIVVGQMIPSVLLVTGMVKGIIAKTEAKTEAK